MFDVIIAGGGPAGLEAALILGRARRRVLLCDTGEPRNAVTGVMHGFLSRDGLDPAELRRIAVDELGRYPTIELRPVAVAAARPASSGFTVSLADGSQETADRLILATGVVDELPDMPGLDELWGRAVFHCSYCDAFERSDQPLAVIDTAATAGFYALQLSGWSPDVVLCTNGPAEIPEEERAGLSARGIALREESIVRLESDGDGARIVFDDGPPLHRQAIFLRPPTRQRSDLAAQLGCNAFDDGSIEVNDFGQTTVPGVFAAGDMARRPAMPFPAAQAIHAASAGGIAAAVADMELAGRQLADQQAERTVS
jgi:thioredoxin reductase